MEFTADQYAAAIITALMSLLILYSGYLIGLKDLKEKSAELTAGFNVELEQKLNQVRGEHESSLKTLKGVFESNRAQLDAAQKQIGLTSQENDHLREQAASLAEVVLELESRTFITELQKGQIRRAARQLSMCAELMDAMFNDENAKTQRLLASQLYDIVQQKEQIQEQAALAEALRKYRRAGGKITKLPGLGMPGRDTPMWNGRTAEALQSITRARNSGLRKMPAAAQAKRAATAAAKRRNKQVLREDWTELDKDNAA